MVLAVCSRCHRHVLLGATSCPFCGAEALGGSSTLGAAAIALGVGLAVAGCGGTTAPSGGDGDASLLADSGADVRADHSSSSASGGSRQDAGTSGTLDATSGASSHADASASIQDAASDAADADAHRVVAAYKPPPLR
jgi:hypothetical protein